MTNSMSIGSSTPKIDLLKWKKLTPQEIIKEQNSGEEVPAEMIAWAQQMAAMANMPDNVTYEQVDGDSGVGTLSKLGIDTENPVSTQGENALPAEETEEPEAVKDPTQTQEADEDKDKNIFMIPPKTEQNSKTSIKDDEDPNKELGLADDKLTTDSEKILKRKERKGLPQ